ncbi:hypothetical protein [Streptomyces sp. NPDC058755]|uniref:hypothetical protein n=1 Tax=Streptomyces sp. NPDC058755 TaxID=3346624 RepID=UPI0036793173
MGRRTGAGDLGDQNPQHLRLGQLDPVQPVEVPVAADDGEVRPSGEPHAVDALGAEHAVRVVGLGVRAVTEHSGLRLSTTAAARTPVAPIRVPPGTGPGCGGGPA